MTAEFPSLRARNLEGLNVSLPEAFAGERNVVVIAFRREHQSLVDSWVPWFERQSLVDRGLRFYELPVISRKWIPVRRFIDGGMSAAIRTPEILRRTFTIYGDVNQVTRSLDIVEMSTITVVCVDRQGSVLWQCRGGFTERLGQELEQILKSHRHR